MKLRPQYSDDEFVQRVDALRQKASSVLPLTMVISVSLGGLAGFLFHVTRSGMLPLFRNDDNQTSFQLGVTAGVALGVVAFAAMFIFVSGLYLHFGGRSDRLLVAYHRRLAELGQLPVNPSG